jgi:CRISPR-associated protein Cas5t
MGNLLVNLKSQTASFRNPDFQNFHKTLDFPPPTAIIGLVGAALGFSPLNAQEFCFENKIKLGVCGVSKGRFKDTWKYSKKTNEMWLYSPGLDGSIIQKEYLIQTSFSIVFKAEDIIIKQLKEGFQAPVFALTMGNSDSLAKVAYVQENLEEVESSEVEHCVVEGNVIENVLNNANKHLEFSIYETKEPLGYDLPISFDYKSDYGRRTVNRIKTLSFIHSKMVLNYLVQGVKYEGQFIPYITLS